MPTLLRAVLIIGLLLLAGVVLVQLLELAINFFGRGFRTMTASIHLPWNPSEKLARAWVYLAMPVCFGGMLLVNMELLLREIGVAVGKAEDFPAPAKPAVMTAQEY